MTPPSDKLPKVLPLGAVLGDGRSDRAAAARDLNATIDAAVGKLLDDASVIAQVSGPRSAADAAEAERRRFLITNIRIARTLRVNCAAAGAITGAKLAGLGLLAWWGWKTWSRPVPAVPAPALPAEGKPA